MLLAALAVGCGVRFRPAVPMRAQSDDVELELVSMRVGLSPEIVLTARSSVPHVIERGYLTVATRAPCTGGAELTRIAIDGEPARSTTLPEGTHTLRIDSPDRLKGYTLDIVADFAMEDGTCARTPVLSQSIPMDPGRRVVVMLGAGALGNTTLAGIKASADFQLGAGASVGPMLLTAHFGVGTAQCVASLCGPGDDGKAKVATTVGGGLSAIGGLPLPGAAFRSSVVTLGARYSYFTTRLPELASGQDGPRLNVHALQALVGWGIGIGFQGPFRHRERTPFMEFAVPVGVMAEQRAFSQVAVVGGIEARFLLDL